MQVINASLEFMNGHTFLGDKKSPLLCHTADPEVKRKIIGDTFMTVANRIIEDMNLDPDKVILGQGTLRPDLIESASSLATVGGAEASCIKTHHNDTNLVRELRAAGKVKTADHLSLLMFLSEGCGATEGFPQGRGSSVGPGAGSLL